MDTATLIDNVINHYDNVTSSDTDNANREARILQFAQEVVDEVWEYREWTFRQASATITVLGGIGGFVALPANFHILGHTGRVYQSATGIQFNEIPYPQMKDFFTNQQTAATAYVFAIGDQDSTTGQKLFTLPYNPASNTDFDIYFLSVPPTLVNTTGNASKLQLVPIAYHNSVILPGVVAKVKEMEGDSRHWYERYQKALAAMAVSERPAKSYVFRVPMTTHNW